MVSGSAKRKKKKTVATTTTAAAPQDGYGEGPAGTKDPSAGGARARSAGPRRRHRGKGDGGAAEEEEEGVALLPPPQADEAARIEAVTATIAGRMEARGIRVLATEGKGRVCVAAQGFEPGRVLLEERAYVHGSGE